MKQNNAQLSGLDINTNIVVEVKELLRIARSLAVHQVNQIMVTTYFEVGRKIVEDQQNGASRAGYGKRVLNVLSDELRNEFGRGFSVDNLENMRKFYLTYSKSETLSRKLDLEGKTFKLSWSHYQQLMRIKNEEERKFYEIESIKENWSVRELKRQFDSGLWERLQLSLDKKQVKELSLKGQVINRPEEAIKEPYVLEFLGLERNVKYSESDLENAIITKIEQFLLELGKGFAFMARQKRISFDERHFFIDLVFYNRLLRCFVLIDLKIGDLKHQDIGQIQMYVNYYDREMKLDEENKTIGLILCKDKSELLVKYTLPENNERIFASMYQTVLPSKDELRKMLDDKK